MGTPDINRLSGVDEDWIYIFNYLPSQPLFFFLQATTGVLKQPRKGLLVFILNIVLQLNPIMTYSFIKFTTDSCVEV